MPRDITSDDFNVTPGDQLLREAAALEAAIEQARIELDAMTQAASAADAAALQTNADYSLHEVAGVGRYVVARYSGWRALLRIIDDPTPNINFSLKDYPAFDKVIGERFNSPYMLDPLDDHYESYKSLRDNIAAVRNFLMETYYADTPGGMTPGKAKKALAEIANFVGDGLYNNWTSLGFIPHHTAGKPHIDLARARAKGGEGAQYIYEKILEHQRHSNWMKPFAAVAALFGGKPAPDWMLPPASATGFTNMIEGDLLPNAISSAPTSAEIEAALARVGQLEAERTDLRGRMEIDTFSGDLDAIADHLLFTATHMANVATLSEPVRRDAIEIAKDILRKLKISLGDLNIMDGLKLKPTDDLSTLGAIKGVAMVYERLLAWGRGIDPSIMEHPSIIAATQAIGQLGYLAKLEALRMARAAGNTVMADNLADQLRRIPPAYAAATDATFGGLLDKVENGINTVLHRTQNIAGPGAKVGHSPGNELGSFMSGTPLAGMAMQTTAGGGVRANLNKQHSDAVAAENAALLARASHTEHNQKTRGRDGAGNAAAPTRSAPGAVRPAARTSSRPAANTSTATPLSAMNATQLQQAQRNTTTFAASHHLMSEEEHLAHEAEQLRLMAQIKAQQALQQRAAVKLASRASKSIHTAAYTTAAHPPMAPHPAEIYAPAIHAPVIHADTPHPLAPQGLHIDPQLLHSFKSATNTSDLNTPRILTGADARHAALDAIINPPKPAVLAASAHPDGVVPPQPSPDELQRQNQNPNNIGRSR
jgi:hypothetical protein